MTFKIKTMNKISPKGLSLFGETYAISDAEAAPDAILVRSAQVDTDLFPGTLAVARAGAGVNNITIDKATAKGMCVFNTPGANANAVAELVFIGLGLALRNVAKALTWMSTIRDITDAKEMDAKVEKGKSQFAGAEYAGKTLGVIGLGKIGVLVSNLASSFGMHVIAYEPFPSAQNMHHLSRKVVVTNNLADVFGKADFLTVHVPLNDKTKNLLNATSLEPFKGTVILNFSRGGIVDNELIKERLAAGTLSAYVTDFPSPAIVNLAGVIALPHLGASTEEAEENCATMAVEQLREYLEFGIVKNSVNFPAISGHPAVNAKVRLVVINQDAPSMIAEITRVIGAAGINIHSFKNESNGKVGYNLIDIQTDVSAAVVEQLSKLDKVIFVRKIALG
jgi:D-3-phosphoglycerate dehydrogenase